MLFLFSELLQCPSWSEMWWHQAQDWILNELSGKGEYEHMEQGVLHAQISVHSLKSY